MEREDPGLQAGDESGAALPVINFDTIHSSINPSNGVLSVLREPSNLISGAERAVEPVDSLPLGRGMIARKPRPRARGSSRFILDVL